MNLEKIEKELIEGKNFDKHYLQLTSTKNNVKRLLDLCESIRKQERIMEALERKKAYEGLEILTKVRSAIKMTYSGGWGIPNHEEFVVDLKCWHIFNGDSADKFINITEEQYNAKEGKGYLETLDHLASFINHNKVNELQRHYNEVNFKNK